MKVWRATAETNDPKTLGLFGSSAGAGMVLAMMLRAEEEGLPLPAALAVGNAMGGFDGNRRHLQNE